MFNRSILQELKIWANKPRRKPLILRGARQVGKTTAIDLFSREFDQFIKLNLDKDEDRVFFEAKLPLNELIDSLFLSFNISSNQKKILIFIDEIQNSANAIRVLRYFYEEANHLYIIAAGSLLETVFDNTISFPVGRVEYLRMHPCSFVEFLEATGEKNAIEVLQKVPFPDFAHQRLHDLFRMYSTIGGMPEVIDSYITEKNIYSLKEIYESLITSMLDDVEKYAKNETQTKVIRHTIRHSLILAGSRITFQGFGESHYKNREMSEAFQMLQKAFLLQLVYPSTQTTLPLSPNYRRSPKIQMMDTGMVNYFTGIQQDLLLSKHIDDTFQGRIAEHIVGQELQTLSSSVFNTLNFWVREKTGSSAEVDFIIQYAGKVIPIEVKSGATGKMKSLFQFIDKAAHPFAVRAYAGKLNVEKGKTPTGKPFVLLNLPFYLVNKVHLYLDWMMDKESVDGQKEEV